MTEIAGDRQQLLIISRVQRKYATNQKKQSNQSDITENRQKLEFKSFTHSSSNCLNVNWFLFAYRQLLKLWMLDFFTK